MARALGVLVAVAASSACYSPELRDCTVSCSSARDCAGDQVCGRDRLCAMPAVADHCSALSIIDAGGGATDAAVDAGGPAIDAAIDAPPPPPPPPPPIALHVHISGGPGAVSVEGHGTCASGKPQNGNCTFMVAANVAETLHAIPALGQKFVAWKSMTCQGEPATCTFTPTVDVTVTAAFAKLGPSAQP